MEHTQYVKKYVKKYKERFSTTPASKYPNAESSDGVSFDAIKLHLEDTVEGLKTEAPRGAWFFCNASAFLDVLTWAAFFDKIIVKGDTKRNFLNKHPKIKAVLQKKSPFLQKLFHLILQNKRKITEQDDYVDFLKKYFFEANSNYEKCYSRLKGSCKDKFAKRIYQTLRCGVLHSLSMKQSMDSWEKGYSILLARRCDFSDSDSTNHHLEIVDLFIDDSGTSQESVIFVAEDMADDIKNCVKKMIELAESTPKLKQNFIDLYKNKPPLGFLDIVKA